MACRESQKIWVSGSLLAKVRAHHQQMALQHLCSSSPEDLAQFVTNVAGPLFPGKAALADHPMTRNGQRLSGFALEAILKAIQGDRWDLNQIQEAVCSWIDTGRLAGLATGETVHADRIADLLEQQANEHAQTLAAKDRSDRPGARLRLSVVATLAPALTTLASIAQAPEEVVDTEFRTAEATGRTGGPTQS